MSGLDSLLQRRPPTVWDKFQSNPLLFLAQRVYAWSKPDVLSTSTGGIQVVCISDTHCAQPTLAPGDILIHAGDLTHSGAPNELRDALAWLSAHPHPIKIVIAGNHDTALADPETRQHILSAYPSLTYLENSATEVTVRGRTVRIFGSPYTPSHGGWSFQYPRAARDRATAIWACIPPLTDILVTHGPPLSHLDLGHTGCGALLAAIWHVRPRLHVFGHIHAARGTERLVWDDAQALYEAICAGTTGWYGLAKLVWVVAVETLRRKRGADQGTILVNASSAGGVRDDERRGAIVVEI